MIRFPHWVRGVPVLALLIVAAIGFGEGSVTADIARRATERLSAEGLDWARVAAVGRDARLTGQAPSPAEQARAVADAQAIPGLRSVDDRTDIMAVRDPYEWRAEKAGEAVALQGAVPNEAVRRAVLGAARQVFPNAAVTDHQELARGAPEGFGDAARVGLEALGRLIDGRIAITGTEVRLTGTADATEAVAAAERVLSELPQGYAKAPIAVRPPHASPYHFEAQRDEGGGLTLSGFVPDDTVRAAVIASIRETMPAVSLADRMTLAEGAPAGYEAMIRFALAQLGRLTTGRATLRDGVFTLRGAAPDGATYAEVTRAVRSGLPAVLTSATANITAPTIAPYILSVVRQGSTVAVRGFVPDDNARADILAAIRAAQPTLTIADRAEIGLGAPQGFQFMAGFAAGLAARLDPGSALLSGGTLTLQGKAGSFDSLDGVTEALKRVPAGLSVARVDIAPPTIKPFTWSALFDGATLSLEGHVPSQAARDQILERARTIAPQGKVVDRMRVASGAPPHFSAAATFGLGQLARLKEGSVSLADDSLSIGGTGRDTVDSAAIAAAAAGPDGLPETVRIAGIAVVPSVLIARPFTLSIRRDLGGVTLDGFVGSAADRAALVEAARVILPGVEIADKLRVAEGQPADMDWVAAGRFALSQIARLRQGTARYADHDFSIEGEAWDRAGYAAANLAVRTEPLPHGGRLSVAEIRPPVVSPYVWFVQKSGAGVVVQGFVPTNALREANREAAARLFAPLPVEDRQELAAGAPEGFAEAALFALTETARLGEGKGAIQDRALRFSGRVSSEEAARELRAALANGPSGFAITIEVEGEKARETGGSSPGGNPSDMTRSITPGPGAADPCLRDVRALVSRRPIAFQVDRDTIRPEGRATLDRVAVVLKRCPAMPLAVEGHTDDAGNAERNVDLSQARALAVVKYLIAHGIPAARLTAQGHGAARPLVPNDTPANRARNRRIEFAARP
jgi:OmpA-OmpF porin, OOP family